MRCGRTADLLLVANEAQDIEPRLWDAVFDPMAASTNATTLVTDDSQRVPLIRVEGEFWMAVHWALMLTRIRYAGSPSRRMSRRSGQRSRRQPLMARSTS